VDVRTRAPDGFDQLGQLAAACAALGLIGRSPPFRAALDLAARFAAWDAPVLLRGSTGNGKELFARLLHALSKRRGGPFVPVNCGALPDTLIESELFGHARGAFTDAKTEGAGLVALAAGGTLLLDEVDALSAKAQVTLLRFLQDQEYRPVGGRLPTRADVRVVAATNADLDHAVSAGRFRHDLRFRLDVLAIAVPSLRERGEDIVPLARFFLARFAALHDRPPPVLTQEAGAWLEAQPWPGNVRELENRMYRALALCSAGQVGTLELGVELTAQPPIQGALYGGGFKTARTREMRAFEARYLRDPMAETKGNVSEAARRAGTERRTMGRMLKRHGIEGSNFQG
jgi:two-component system, NtrC family, response regulator GlrR